MTDVTHKVASEDLARLYAIGVAQQTADQFAAAIETYRRCLLLSPHSPEIHNNLGTALDRAGRLAEAEECFRRAHALDPAYARPLVNLGKVLRLQRRASEALACLERALALAPDHAAALTNIGFVLTDLGRRVEAIRHLRRAIALDVALAEAYHGLGRALLDSGDASAAVDSLQRALSLKPSLTEACLPLAVALTLLQRLPEALGVLERALESRPDDSEALAERLNCSLRMCDWERVADTLRRLRGIPGGASRAAPFLLMAVSDVPEEHLEAARIRAAAIARDRIPMPPSAGRARSKIRVAYVSGDFHTHATSFLIAELLELHDRSAFEVFGVSFGPDDASPLRRRVHAAFDECLEAREKSDADVAAWLRQREIDIAVDLKGYTAFSRPGIFAYRPAPVQVSYLGYPGTMAAPFIDYIIADPWVIPESERGSYTEKIAYLPDCYQVNDRGRRIGERVPTRAEAGLPDTGFVFCCFNNSWKITAPVFESWMRLLDRVPGSVLWLLQDNRWAAESLRRQATKLGIAAERLVFSARTGSEDHLARHRLADLFLDTFPYNAHTTASDALWTGLPLLTRCGRSFGSRVAGSLLRAAGLPELITASPEEYERVALDLALHPVKLQPLRRRLARPESLPLFDTPAFCRHLEAAYRRMWTLHAHAEAVPFVSGAEGHVRRGIALARLGQLESAEECFERALREDPKDADAHYNLGNTRAVLRRGEPALAAQSFSRALGLNPRYPGARWNMALLKLLGGEWREGWELYEERFSIGAGRGPAPRRGQPRWTGREDLKGRRILLWAERGLGDTLQFCRYAPLVRDRGADVTLAVQPRLQALLASQFAGVRVIGQDEPLGSFDYQCPLLSLPRAFDTQPDTVPAPPGYLAADAEAVRRWSARLPPDAAVRIGIAWQGNAEAEKNWARGRSMPLAALAPLARREDVCLISLQSGEGARQLESSGFAERIVSFGDALDAGPDAFLDTAAVVASLDLVISTDTAVAHLAGALGAPVWVALHATSEWRWLLARGDSPWYPRMRLFRQRTPGRWDEVVEEICIAVGALRSPRPASQGSGAA